MERIGPYRFVAQLGQGGMGAVFRAIDERSGQEVAVKVLAVAEPAARQRFLVEAQALARLRHRNVVSLLEAGDERGRPYLVLELIRGRSLEERLARQGPLPARAAAELVGALALAIAHAHGERVLHRDLKPSNVLLPDDGGPPRLTDFGLASLTLEDEASRLTRSGAMLGTPGFWSPEQAAGKTHEIGPASDVYGLGALLYAALTARAPVEGESLHEVLAATISQVPTPPGVDPGLDALALRCLDKTPAKRPGSADAVARELARWLATRSERRSGRGLALAAASVLALGLAAALILLAMRRTPEVAATPVAPVAPIASATPSPFEQAMARGREHERVGSFAAAEEAFEQALALDPASADAVMRRGFMRFYQGDAERALVDYDRALELDPGHYDTQCQRAITLLRMGRPSEGLVQIDAAIRAFPQHALPLSIRGMIQNESGDALGGLASCDRAIALDPTGAYHHHTRAASLIDLDRLAEALAALDQALVIEPGYEAARRQRAELRRHLGDLAGAEEDLELLRR